MSTKAISLYSGGLDSILAIKVLLEAANTKIEIIPVRIITPFFNYKDEEEFAQEKKYLKNNFNINLKIVEITEEYIKLLYNPKYGFGKNLNPCIDCKILMLKKAKELMEKEKASFIITGEVVGQRPKSQRMDKIRLIEKAAGLKGKLLRPLSAKLLKETICEENKIINRQKLLDINGRSRKFQLALAKKYNIKYFATPSGGCLLTDREYAKKLKLLQQKIPLDSHMLKFLNWGRVFLINKDLLIIGRNDLENKKLLKLASENDLLLQPKNIPGPLSVVLRDSKVSGYQRDKKKLKLIADICAKYSLKKDIKANTLVIQYGIKNNMMENIKDLKQLTLSDSINAKPLLENKFIKYKV